MEKEKKKDNKVSRVLRILLVVFLLVVFIYHRIMLKKEANRKKNFLMAP